MTDAQRFTSELLVLMTVASLGGGANNNVPMERVHMNIGEWFAITSAKLTSGVFDLLKRATEALRSCRASLVVLGYRAKISHLRLQEALREKELHISKMLANSCDPMVVTDDSHRLVAANKPALALFGVSKSNIGKFTIDAFLSPSHVHCFERSGPPFVKGKARLGECEIRRLDGKVKLVGFIFQSNVILGRHLSRFQVQEPKSHGLPSI